MTDIDALVEEFWRTLTDGAVGVSFFKMRRLLEILKQCLNMSEVCFVIIPVFATAIDLADKNSQNSWQWHSAHSAAKWDPDDQIRVKFKMLFDRYRKMFDLSISKSKDLGDTLKFLPGVVVQKQMSMQGMADLYRVKPDLLERLIKSTIMIEPLRLCPSHYILDDYLSGCLQDRDQHYYCDPILQHIFICRHFLSLLDGSKAFDLQS